MKKISLIFSLLSIISFSSIAQTWTTSAAIEGNMPTSWSYNVGGGGIWGGDFWLVGANTYVEFTFTGTQVRIKGILTPSIEIVNVGVDCTSDIYIDGVLVEDNFNGWVGESEVGGVLIYTSPVVANAVHTIRVELNAHQLGINAFEYIASFTSCE